jgi:hypothetical protein
MSRIETIRSIEVSLKLCRDLAASIGDDALALAYYIDMAILEAGESAPGDEQILTELKVAEYPSVSSARLAPVKNTQ